MDRLLLVASTFCFLFGLAYTVRALGARAFRSSPLNFAAILGGFGFQTAFLVVRGEAVQRCPLTTLPDVLVFLSWSIVVFYLLIGSSYRLSLLGAFTSPIVFFFQMTALFLPVRAGEGVELPVSFWLELHAALSVVAYGAFALAFVAGIMYLVQERQLKTHHIRSIFYNLPPIHDLATANRRLIFVGFTLFTVGLFAGILNGPAHIPLLWFVSLGVWMLYAGILTAIHWHRISPKRVAILSVSAFSLMLITLWSIQLAPGKGL